MFVDTEIAPGTRAALFRAVSPSFQRRIFLIGAEVKRAQRGTVDGRRGQGLAKSAGRPAGIARYTASDLSAVPFGDYGKASVTSIPKQAARSHAVTRILLSTGNILVSLILGALLFGFVFIQYPETMSSILDAASGFKAWLIGLGITTEYNNWIRVLLEERQLVFMGFTILARIGLSILTYPIVMWREHA